MKSREGHRGETRMKGREEQRQEDKKLRKGKHEKPDIENEMGRKQTEEK